jgi:large subunit ribosomal protein L15
MLVHELQTSPGFNKPAKRLGRWNWSWKGNYSWKWLKGQKARSGWGVPWWFEWGQTPLIRRMPKLRWFKRFFKFLKHVTPVNLLALERDPRVVSWMEITPVWLSQSGYCDGNSQIKILWDWNFTKQVTFVGIDSFSSSAKLKIEKAQSVIA